MTHERSHYDPSDPNRDGSQDHRLTDFEITKLEKHGIRAEELKDFRARYDLFKDQYGNIFVKPKNMRGRAPGEFTGLNINQLE